MFPFVQVDLTDPRNMIHAAYACISGLRGVPRDWATYRSLYHSTARLMPTQPTPGGASTVEVFDVEGYIASRTPYFVTNDFFEVEIARQEIRFGNITTVLSAYESRRTSEGPPFMRGLNSFQLWWDGTRWWIMAVLWDNEREGLTLPAELC
jgi:hypothetical protein